ncbi:deoxyribodipyrimidine photo-lyase [Idiomarina sp. HP20-50]|uniref:deoxyribodipyrimidine photo-lyase n=1 Tax=Idiomarina sp. HP20-50 TaxID=3070813 RepID=UPI00294AAE88|nr:deoxyribodipyrimidine photo-lyase [Idiomarina sp. HP20-50]MDV6315014.1 deoxyribodipyrimidine photo-lyase [Idiomarina sp. HP20-50]
MRQAIWFRSDLRTLDNPALFDACNGEQPPLAVFFACCETWERHNWAPIKIDFLWRNLESLQQGLAEKGIQLEVQLVPKFSQVPGAIRQFCHENHVERMQINAEYALDEKRRDAAVEAVLSRDDIELVRHHGNVLVAPGQVRTQQGEYYKKFTPFNRRWRQVLNEMNYGEPLQAHSFEPVIAKGLPNCPGKSRDSSHWVAGEQEALGKLGQFVGHSIENYQQARDLPAQTGTSQLSAYLALGVVGPQTAARALHSMSPEFPFGLPTGADTWLTELAWREFYQHLMYFVPRLSKGESFQTETDRIQWLDDDNAFQCWCKGRTGYPIVDAGMRQLTSTGWMHNRLRMITANFLVKDLMVDWRKGEAFFMKHLIDGSFPANNGGWQWSASVGTDAVPYFRVFNPVRQSEKFDPDGDYIRKWVNELKEVPTKHIHWPHSWLQQKSSNNYCEPVVEHRFARERFLTRFKQVKHG